MMLTLLAAAALDPPLEEYAALATGHFSSAAQHRSDPRYDEVETRVVRIWPERTDGLWLYQEQAIVNQPGKTRAQALASPYFQFVARIVPLKSGSFRRDNHRVREGARFAGGKTGTLTQADLMEAGCHNRIDRIAAAWFTGTTESCANRYKGAASMLSLSVLTNGTYVNWDRGFDLVGARVWGPEEGGYIFDRVVEADVNKSPAN
ncbi:chromophore lyase CpcT/CpeT [Sphingomonas sp.]|jgi:hypothetical protein|uniref:chromophore lyase CpcT/CpeT n=1 Tax=Sphingomonas sp. TaxID=28214 RepID=UPI002DEB9857|nr:chromophore lyase CpcT/CpeT [Sphingomonas sp.]